MAKQKKFARVKSLLEEKRDNKGVRDVDFFLLPLGAIARPPEDKKKKKKDLLKQGAKNISVGAKRRHELLKKVMEEI